MRIQLQTNKTRYEFDEPIRCALTRTDVEPHEPIIEHGYCGFVINGKTVYYEESENRDLTQSLFDYWDAIGTLCTIDFQVEVRRGQYPNVQTAISPEVRLEIDLRDVEVLNTAAGLASCYVRNRRGLFFIWNGSRGHGKSQRKVAADLESARALNDQTAACAYLVDRESVFRNGVLVKGLSAADFKIYSAVFAGDPGTVLTPYGNAKVVHPAQFVALDDGDRFAYKKDAESDGYKAGYGRDDLHVYWFDCSIGSAHATVVRACKEPQTFISLDYGYGKDASHVYLEGVRIQGADPHTWELLNRLYSRDRKNVYFGTRKVEAADRDSFRVVADPDEASLFDSMNGQDASRNFLRWEIAA